MISYSVIIFSILERNGEINGLNKKLDKCIKEKDLSSQFNLSFCVNFHFSLNFWENWKKLVDFTGLIKRFLHNEGEEKKITWKYGK